MITNVVTTTWTSLADNPYGNTRTGAGGVNDYLSRDSAAVAVSSIRLNKTGPLTVTAGSLVTYVLSVQNVGPLTVSVFTVEDIMPFQVTTLSAVYTLTTGSGGPCPFTSQPSGDKVVCTVSNVPATAGMTVTIVGRVDPTTPPGADLTNRATATAQLIDGTILIATAEVETEVYASADLGVVKSGSKQRGGRPTGDLHTGHVQRRPQPGEFGGYQGPPAARRHFQQRDGLPGALCKRDLPIGRRAAWPDGDDGRDRHRGQQRHRHHHQPRPGLRGHERPQQRQRQQPMDQHSQYERTSCSSPRRT